MPYLTRRKRKQAYRDMGQRHKCYLKEYRKATYSTLLTSGKLNSYLADIEEQAQERFERLVENMKLAQGITEQLKMENAEKTADIAKKSLYTFPMRVSLEKTLPTLFMKFHKILLTS